MDASQSALAVAYIMSTYWESRKPIFERLPYIGYQDNPVVSWVTSYWDEFLCGLRDKVEGLPRQLDPLTCDAEWLDYLAPLLGFTRQYWSRSWSEDVKRSLLANSPFIWRNRGTLPVLNFVLEIFLGSGNFNVWQPGEFLAGITVLPGELGVPEWRYLIRLPETVRENGREFRIARLINKLYGVAHCNSAVVYDGYVFTDDDEIVHQSILL